MAANYRTLQKLRTFNLKAIRMGDNLCPQFSKFFHDNIDPVALFEAQFGGIPHQGSAGSAESRHGKDGEFIDHANDDLPIDLNPVEGAALDPQIGDRLSRLRIGILYANLAAHGL